ncbi:PepSY-associated TM helix domain-containing protein [Flaviaesturariibacter amylovorans]|uniref:PepSY-associated TM helix domain-containing protein n=1 Tax=Flaviaesturariibacter amylovorans TaxID=1084520 RepID=A0ABP8HP47_9BACT
MSRASRLLFSVHSWLGLIAGIFILSFFLTGSVIVFNKELNRWQHPELHTVTDTGARLPFDSLYRSALRRAPQLYLYTFRKVPKAPGETVEMRVYDPAKKEYGLLYLNPYSGAVLGTTWNNSLYDLLLTMHFTFFLGKVGELMAGVFALALLGSVITGLIVYRRHLVKVLTFRMKMQWRNWRMISSNLHRVIGVWSLLFNLVLAGSGFYMMLYAFDLKAQFGSNASTAIEPPPTVSVNVDTLIREATGLLREGRFHYLDFPRRAGEPLTVYTDGGFWLWGDLTNKVEFNSGSGVAGRVFRQGDMSAGEKAGYALYTLHYGQYGGTGIKLLYSFFALSGSVLAITGFVLWYRKRRGRRKKPAR